MKGVVVIFFILLVSAANMAPGSSRTIGDLVGGWEPIKDLKDPHVQEIAEFAVAQHNQEAHVALKLKSVVKGETQVVSGTNYRLVLEAADGPTTGNYEAVVWEKPWLHYKNLTSFKPINQPY